ncbi:(+)-borneol dehydrogenase 1-like [Euphorbia lathyris]|uniref:(+)-borneol dehydrogenase 1-like n=1 Tax=Euphorbia lathyris TaxID=212925 RepID=UPI0033134631
MEKETIPILVTPEQRLAGKVAIITGGASGIGASTVQLFHENGAKVVIADIQDALGRALAQKLGQNAIYIHCDVSKEEEIRSLVDQTVNKYGKLDIMYNNAGIVDRPFTRFIESKKSDLDRLISINLIGAILGAKHAARVMIPQQKACILFTTSACTAIGGLGTQSYALTKHGIWGLSKSLASELSPNGIRVNCISPFGIATPVAGITVPRFISDFALSFTGNLKGQILKTEDIAKAALYLASDEANHVSGLNLVVDGGFSVVNPSFVNLFASSMRSIYFIQRVVKLYGTPLIASFMLGCLVVLISMSSFMMI